MKKTRTIKKKAKITVLSTVEKWLKKNCVKGEEMNVLSSKRVIVISKL